MNTVFPRQVSPRRSPARLAAWALLPVAVFASIAAPLHAHAADAEGYETDLTDGVQLIRRTTSYNGSLTNEDRSPGLPIKRQFDAAWARNIGPACAQIKAGVAAAAAAIRPTRLVNCDLVATGDLRARVRGRNLEYKYLTHNNVVTFWITTPDLCVDIPIVGEQCVGAPRELDPKFTVTFDSELHVRVPVHGQPRQLRADQATARVRNARMDSNNVTGDMVAGVEALIRAFGGPGLFRIAEDALNALEANQLDDVNAGLALLDRPIQTAAAGYERMRPLLENRTVAIELSRRQLSVDDITSTTPGTGRLIEAAPIAAREFDGNGRALAVEAAPVAAREFDGNARALAIAPSGFGGAWLTTYGDLTLRQNGDQVEGEYPSRQGRIVGTAAGEVLRGRWNEGPNQSGDVEVTLVDANHFRACWRHGSSSEMRCNWEGRRP